MVLIFLRLQKNFNILVFVVGGGVVLEGGAVEDNFKFLTSGS